MTTELVFTGAISESESGDEGVEEDDDEVGSESVVRSLVELLATLKAAFGGTQGATYFKKEHSMRRCEEIADNGTQHSDDC